jgi:N-acetylglucosamine kinase-like BadF-type ATPase
MEVGIDVGGTKTQIVVADGGAPLADTTLPTAHWRQGPLFSDQANARRLLDSVPDGAVGRPDVPLAAGVHGCDSVEQCQTLEAWLRAIHPGPVLVVNDSELFGPAAGFARAVNVVAGTGSIVVGRTATGKLVKKGGFGWLLGDPGSAPALVRESVRAILQAHDSGDHPGPLARALMDHYGSPDPVQLGYDFTADAEITHWGALSPKVFEAAAAGDRIAADVIGQQAAELAEDARWLRARGALGDDVVIAGGVAQAQPALTGAFTRRLAQLDPNLRVTVLQTPPVLGALKLARLLTTNSETEPKQTEE